jgi:hypothetical protein
MAPIDFGVKGSKVKITLTLYIKRFPINDCFDPNVLENGQKGCFLVLSKSSLNIGYLELFSVSVSNVQ